MHDAFHVPGHEQLTLLLREQCGFGSLSARETMHRDVLVASMLELEQQLGCLSHNTLSVITAKRHILQQLLSSQSVRDIGK